MNKDKTSFEIIETKQITCKNCKLNYIHVKVQNITQKAEEMVVDIIDNSWLKELDNEIDYNSFLERSRETIEDLVKILKSIGNEIGAEFGEYMISSVAQSTLQNSYNHDKFPLAELWKEKAKGNPGFDFHTISSNSILFFGEAKFNSNQNAYSTAISQICRFIDKKKDVRELTDLQKLNKSINEKHLTQDFKGYVAAFSVLNNFENIFKTIQENNKVKQYLHKYPEVFFIGIEI